jgi:hypothetical protein
LKSQSGGRLSTGLSDRFSLEKLGSFASAQNARIAGFEEVEELGP